MKEHNFVLSFAFNTRGFAFVLFEGQLTPRDWGTVTCTGEDRRARMHEKAVELVGRYHPDIVTLQDFGKCGARRSESVRQASFRVEHAARMKGCGVERYTPAQLRAVFAPFGARSKRDTARAIAEAIPAFSHRLPPVRKAWMTEDRRQLLFDAAGLGWATYLEMIADEQGLSSSRNAVRRVVSPSAKPPE